MSAVSEWVPYRRGSEILRTLADMVMHKAPAGLYLLAGPPDNGKTAIVDQLRRMYPPRIDRRQERSHFPILALDMPPRPGVNVLLRKALGSAGAPVISCALERGIAYLGGVLRGVDSRLIVLDDAQHILAGTPSQRTLFLSFWSDVAASAGAALCLVGTARVFELGPLVEKAGMLLLPAWPLDQEFADMVRTLERHLSLGRSFIGADDIPILHEVSAGKLGALVAVMTSLAGRSPMLAGALREQVALELRFQRVEDVVRGRTRSLAHPSAAPARGSIHGMAGPHGLGARDRATIPSRASSQPVSVAFRPEFRYESQLRTARRGESADRSPL
jgi:hypothetical protein